MVTVEWLLIDRSYRQQHWIFQHLTKEIYDA
jgi:hypothetical protein